MRYVFLLITLILTPVSALASQPVPVGAGAVQAHAAALALAKTTRSEEATRATFEALRFNLAEILLQDDDSRRLEADYPGILGFAVEKLAPIYEGQVIKDLPAMQEKYAALYQSHMTAEEMVVARKFYESSAGQRLINSLVARFDYRELIGETLKSSQGITAASLQQGVVKAVPAAIGDMRDDERQDLIAFGKTSAFVRIKEINPQMLQMAAAEGQNLPPGMEAQMTIVAKAAFVEFIAAHPTDHK